MILTVNKISLAFGEKEVLRDITFTINEYEKAAIIGINGAGKSTLLKIIMGELQADAGDIILAKGAKVGYLAQHQDLNGTRSIYNEILSIKQNLISLEERMRNLEISMKHAEGDKLTELCDEYTKVTHAFESENGYAYRSQVVGVLKGLGFTEEEFEKPISVLSGGERTRVALAKLLVTPYDLILLDEPTNHLDMSSIQWLETFLQNYKGAVLVVSHDRYFMNKIASKIVEIENTKSLSFSGNYEQYAEKKALVREAERKAYLNQQAEIKHQEEVIAKLKSFNREKSIKRAESREKALDKVERLEKPMEVRDSMRLEFHPNVVSGNDVLMIEDLRKGFASEPLFSNLNCTIHRGEHVAIIGDNGAGKTTLLKIIRGLLPADSGLVREGAKVYQGYYDQEQQGFDPEKTVFDELHDAYPDMTNTQVRNTLAAFLFTGDEVFQQIKSLSGGERGRLSLAKLLLSNANFLILDEPTNHLDIRSKEILEEALRSYTGTLLYVSHDRYFINRTATRILNLTRNRFIDYDGNYDYYLEKKDTMEQVVFGEEKAVEKVEVITENKLDWQAKKEAQANKRKLENRIQKIEEQIAKLESEIADIDAKMLLPEICTNSFELGKLAAEKDEKDTKLMELMEEWEELSSEE